ncbi:hypothetical protein PAPYR_6220 [Paratrimastix pyriformis]|uniref:F-box domain-containing protein n=1 Tax=Paratrimastix pyriformis TaxID=342808 RepID=A0ABQ8UI73_9EUKA|nr:hypothetical protein PAPYR_6220 [Paratrimastix pyriformis]
MTERHLRQLRSRAQDGLLDLGLLEKCAPEGAAPFPIANLQTQILDFFSTCSPRILVHSIRWSNHQPRPLVLKETDLSAISPALLAKRNLMLQFYSCLPPDSHILHIGSGLWMDDLLLTAAELHPTIQFTAIDPLYQPTYRFQLLRGPCGPQVDMALALDEYISSGTIPSVPLDRLGPIVEVSFPDGDGDAAGMVSPPGYTTQLLPPGDVSPVANSLRAGRIPANLHCIPSAFPLPPAVEKWDLSPAPVSLVFIAGLWPPLGSPEAALWDQTIHRLLTRRGRQQPASGSSRSASASASASSSTAGLPGWFVDWSDLPQDWPRPLAPSSMPGSPALRLLPQIPSLNPPSPPPEVDPGTEVDRAPLSGPHFLVPIPETASDDEGKRSEPGAHWKHPGFVAWGVVASGRQYPEQAAIPKRDDAVFVSSRGLGTWAVKAASFRKLLSFSHDAFSAEEDDMMSPRPPSQLYAELPPEILAKIFGFLTPRAQNMAFVGAVCHSWHQAVLNSSLWFLEFIDRHGDLPVDHYLFEETGSSEAALPSITCGQYWRDVACKHSAKLREVDEYREKLTQKAVDALPKHLTGDDLDKFIMHTMINPVLLVAFLVFLILLLLRGEDYALFSLHWVMVPLDVIILGGPVLLLVFTRHPNSDPRSGFWKWASWSVALTLVLLCGSLHWAAQRADWSFAHPATEPVPTGLQYPVCFIPVYAGLGLIHVRALPILALILWWIALASILPVVFRLDGTLTASWAYILVPVHVMAGIVSIYGTVAGWLLGWGVIKKFGKWRKNWRKSRNIDDSVRRSFPPYLTVRVAFDPAWLWRGTSTSPARGKEKSSPPPRPPPRWVDAYQMYLDGTGVLRPTAARVAMMGA